MAPTFALVIGNDYRRTPSARLNGCIRDANRIYNYLHTRQKIPQKNITRLRDGSKRQMQKQITRLITRANQGRAARIWFSYSGHGSQVRDHNRDERDGRDEVLVPADFNRRGFITDDWLRKQFLRLNRRTQCTAIVDCCNSGTVFDLPFKSQLRKFNAAGTRRPRVQRARILVLSACSDSQYAAETRIGGKVSGVLTTFFLRIVQKQPRVSVRQLLAKLEAYFRQQGIRKQTPHLSSTQRIRKNKTFI